MRGAAKLAEGPRHEIENVQYWTVLFLLVEYRLRRCKFPVFDLVRIDG
jgi:hypothetical protein